MIPTWSCSTEPGHKRKLPIFPIPFSDETSKPRIWVRLNALTSMVVELKKFDVDEEDKGILAFKRGQ